jgi:hypothetical protein
MAASAAVLRGRPGVRVRVVLVPVLTPVLAGWWSCRGSGGGHAGARVVVAATSESGTSTGCATASLDTPVSES